jgi:predicted kinase
MPRLIHLNGPSAMGKSTVAQLYADRHPGVLNLDTDRIVSLIGGWREDFWTALTAGRLLAIGMAETHLASGHDVVMPQLVTRPDEVDRFEEAARQCGAEYHEFVLMGDKQLMRDRFAGRAASADQAPHRFIDEILERSGGPTLLARIHDHLSEYLARRANLTLVDTAGRAPEEIYQDIVTVLAQRSSAKLPTGAA